MKIGREWALNLTPTQRNLNNQTHTEKFSQTLQTEERRLISMAIYLLGKNNLDALNLSGPIRIWYQIKAQNLGLKNQ